MISDGRHSIPATGPALALVLAAVLFAGCGLFGEDGEFGVRRDLVRRLSDARASERTCGSTQYDAAVPLRWNSPLEQAALRHARDLAVNGGGGHEGSDGSTVSGRIRDAGYNVAAAGEIVAVGPGSMDDVVRSWLESPGHCSVIMNAGLIDAGGAAQGRAWVVDFGRER